MWVKRDFSAEVVGSLDLRQVFVEMPLLLEKLREAVSLTNTIAREGIIVEKTLAGNMRNIRRDTTREPLLHQGGPNGGLDGSGLVGLRGGVGEAWRAWRAWRMAHELAFAHKR